MRLESLTMTLTSPRVLTNVSVPARPSIVSWPESPRKTLSRLFPDIVSAALLPTTFSMPSLLKSVTSNPPVTSCAVVCSRSTVSPAPPESVTAEKSSVSLSALATSTILTLVDVSPTNTYESFPRPPSRIRLPPQPFTVNLLAPLPPTRSTTSMLTSTSDPTPAIVAAVTVASTLPVSIAVSVPAPPSSVLLPARPPRVSSPPRPVIELSRALPSIVSAAAVPVTSSIPVASESVNVSVAVTAWGDVSARSTLTPVSPLSESAEKSIASVFAPASSTMAIDADTAPTKT